MSIITLEEAKNLTPEKFEKMLEEAEAAEEAFESKSLMQFVRKSDKPNSSVVPNN